MSSRMNILYDKKPCYDIVFSTDFGELQSELEALGMKERKVCVITDSKVASLYGDEVMECLSGMCHKNVLFLSFLIMYGNCLLSSMYTV